MGKDLTETANNMMQHEPPVLFVYGGHYTSFRYMSFAEPERSMRPVLLAQLSGDAGVNSMRRFNQSDLPY